MSKLLVAVLLLTSFAGCNKKAPAGTQPGTAEPAPAPTLPANMDTPVLVVFNGNDAHAMAGLGHELETRRPPLTQNVLKEMLATLRKDPGKTEQIQKMRPLLFRTAAVIIGRPALPLLSDCVATLKDLSQLCGGALQEIEAAAKK
jgi:hypothetical protein